MSPAMMTDTPKKSKMVTVSASSPEKPKWQDGGDSFYKVRLFWGCLHHQCKGRLRLSESELML